MPRRTDPTSVRRTWGLLALAFGLALAVPLGPGPGPSALAAVSDPHRAEFEFALERDDLDRVKRYLAEGTGVNSTGDHEPPLGLAVTHNALNVARYLISKGADVNARSPIEGPLLLMAIQRGGFDAAALLVEAGANPNVRGNSNETPLIALAHQVPPREATVSVQKLLAVLLAKGANVLARDDLSRTCFQNVLNEPLEASLKGAAVKAMLAANGGAWARELKANPRFGMVVEARGTACVDHPDEEGRHQYEAFDGIVRAYRIDDNDPNVVVELTLERDDTHAYVSVARTDFVFAKDLAAASALVGKALFAKQELSLENGERTMDVPRNRRLVLERVEIKPLPSAPGAFYRPSLTFHLRDGKTELADTVEMDTLRLLTQRDAPYLDRFEAKYSLTDLKVVYARFDKFAPAVAEGRLAVGMSAEMVKAAWGDPSSINRTTDGAGAHEQWVYGENTLVYLDNGKLTSWQN